MTVRELINTLENLVQHGLTDTAIVRAFDADVECFVPVNGFVYDNFTVEICTDEG